jgi:hypothetical protein
MDLIERYLAAVRRNLPADKATDVTAELREDLFSRIEQREESLGRTLDKNELSTVIKDSGHPLVVASRYRQQQQLIGPETYPFFIFTLKLVLLIVGVIIIITAFAAMAFGGADPWQAIARAVGQLAMYSLVNGGVVTLAFAILDRNGFAAKHIRAWKPETLPDVGEERRGQWEGPLEVALTIAFLLWWTGLVSPEFRPGGSNFRMEAAPIWQQLYLPILLLALARLVHNVIQWLRPRWKTVRLMLGAATAIGALALLPSLYSAGEWARIVPLGMPVEAAASLQDSLNLALRIAIIAVGVIWLLGCLGELWRLSRAARERRA